MSRDTHSRERAAAVGTIVLTLLGWSSIPLFLKHFSHDIDAWTANGWRYGFSALMWLPVLLVHWNKGTMPKGLWRAALVPSVFNVLGQVLFGFAPYLIDPGLMTFGLRLQIVFVTIGAAILFPVERALLRRPAFLAGLVVVFSGTLLTIALKPDGLGRGSGLGVALAIASGLFYACYSLSVRKWLHGVPALTAFAAVSQYTAMGMLVPMLIFGRAHGAEALHMSGGQFSLLLLSAIIGIGLGHTMYFFSIARLGVAVSAGVVQLQPIIVSLASIELFGEHFTTWQWISGTMAVTGAAMMLVVQHFHAQHVGQAARRKAAGECVWCGYSMIGIETEKCPECGKLGRVA